MEDSVGRRKGENPLAPGEQQKPTDISESSLERMAWKWNEVEITVKMGITSPRP